ncbi:MAG: AAA family ATPase, partial [Chloroflexota bacterium]
MAIAATGIVSRRLETVVAERLTEEPVVVLNGARTVGKSTLLQRCAQAHGVDVLDLDDPATRESVQADPTFFVSGSELVFIDEIQHLMK